MAATRTKQPGSKRAQAGRSATKRSTAKRAAAKPAKSKRKARAAELAGVFESVSGRFGVGLGILVEERQGEEVSRDSLLVSRFAVRPGQRPRSALLGLSDPANVARLLAGLAHPDRVRLARAMAIGACTHEALSKAVPLKTGPLYHHLRELERAGISRTVARNTYGLTGLGRLALFVVGGLAAGATEKNPWKHKVARRRTRA